MWPKFLNSKLFASLLTVTITVITTIAVQGFISKEKYKDMVKNDMEKRATIEYVDKRDKDIVDYVNKQDESNRVFMQQYIEGHQKTTDIMLKYLESIASDVRDIKTKR